VFRAALRPGVLVASAVLTLSACAAVVAGRPSLAAADAGPLAHVRTSIDISDIGSGELTTDIGPDGAGGVLVLSDEPERAHKPDRLVHFTRSGDGLAPDAGRDLPQVIYTD